MKCFIWGKMKASVQETASQIALENCSKEVGVGGRSIYLALILQKVFC